MALPLGTLLLDRFRIDALLGQGGMGAVYRARDLVLDRPIALKEMVPPPGTSEEEVAQLRKQFKKEASVLANLSHPGLPRVTDYFTWDQSEFLVMDYVPGESLGGRLSRLGPLPEGQVLDWAGQLLDALTYCHRQGVIHRDVKPANIILTPEGRAVLVDFGLVKVWTPEHPQTMTAMRGAGTPAYAPPEQYVEGAGHTDARSDLYSLGGTLYEALTGRKPPQAHLRMADPTTFPAPRALKPGLSARTERTVLRAMEMSKAQRFGSAEEMRAALPVPGPAGEPGAGREGMRMAPAAARGGAPRAVDTEETRVAPRAARLGLPPARSRPWGRLLAAALASLLGVIGLGVLLSRGCGGPPPQPLSVTTQILVVPPSATETHLSPTGTAAAPTNTPIPPTNTLPPPTNTPVPPTYTPAPPTDTPAPPTDTPVPLVQTSTVIVPANVEWLYSGIIVRSGAELWLSAAGTWAHEPYGSYGPDGTEKYDSMAYLPEHKIGVLIGQIGQGAPFAIGRSASFTAPADGELLLAMNDAVGTYDNNIGSLQVQVEIHFP